MNLKKNATARLGQCRELEYILIGDIRDLLEEAPTSETVRWLKAVIDTLLKTMPEEFALKSESGYLQEVLDEFPSWDDMVNRLEDDYRALYRRLLHLRHQLDLGENYKRNAPRISNELRLWMDRFRDHVRNENKLVLLAINLEVGGGD